MSHLQRVRTQNLKQFDKVKKYLQQHKTEISKINSIVYQPPPQQRRQKTIVSQLPQQANEQDDDSFHFGFEQYLKAKNQKSNHTVSDSQQQEIAYKFQNNYKSAQNSDYRQNKPVKKREESTFNLEKYVYNPSDQQHTEPQEDKKLKLKEKVNKLNRQKAEVNNNLGALINRCQKKVRIEDVLIKQQPVKINYIKADNKEWQNHKKNEDFRLDYVLRKFPNIKAFKNNQKAIIKCGLQNHNIFVCMPTGGGKSLTFQVLTFLNKGIYVCVLPLISLIFDQEYQAKLLGIEAYSLTANTKSADLRQIFQKLDNFRESENSIVIFCTPEKLNLSQQFSDLLETVYQRQQLKRFIIDEVHCVSTWGKDFRAQYENLSSLKLKFPKTPILGLTATVTEVVKQDIITRLGIQGCYFFQSSFNRPNLFYEVRQKTKNILEDIEAIIRRYKGLCGIIYCLSKRQCEQISSKLNNRGHKTAFYHADINEDDKKNTQELWMDNKINIIVATVAFGMGINKPDVRFVIHHTMSKSLENYYQESGRAGRDGEFSECILFYRKSDKQFLQSMNLQNDFSTLQRKEFTTKQLAQIIKYCEDKSTCRRQFQLHYLGELDFDSKECNRTCDNCKKGATYLEFQCIIQGKALVQFMMKAEDCRLSLSKKQLIDIIRGKADSKFSYKLQRLERVGADFASLKQSFQKWKINEIQSLIVELLSYDILTEKIVKNQIFKKNKESEVVNVYLKCNAYRCKLFLDKVETLPFKRLTSSKPNFENVSSLESGYIEETQEDSGSEQIKLNEKVQDWTERYQRYKQLLDDIFEQDLEQQ